MRRAAAPPRAAFRKRRVARARAHPAAPAGYRGVCRAQGRRERQIRFHLRGLTMGYAALVLALMANIAGAQDYPSKPIRLILPQSPGSATDVLARLIAPRMSEALGQPLIIDNRAGAGGIVGAETAAKSPPEIGRASCRERG